jgi:hypothetical protein
MSNNTSANLSFFGCVDIAVRGVTAQYPDAQLYEVDASPNPPQPNGVTSIEALNSLRCVFLTKAGGKTGTVIISSSDQWGEFGAVKYIDEPWTEDVVIDWPPADDIMPPTKAYILMTQAGYTQPFLNMTFRHPLYPFTDEPKYMFALGDFSYVVVGAVSGKVESEHDPPEK